METPDAADEDLLQAALAIADGVLPDGTGATPAAQTLVAGLASDLPSSGLRDVARIVDGHRRITRPLGDETLLTAARRSRPDAGADLRVRWGPLIVLDKIGRGTFGDVYRAWDPRLDREVALKLLRDDTSARFGSPVIEEGRLLARVRHPNVVTVYGAERIDGRVGIWMEFVRGRTLAEDVRTRGPLAPAEALTLGRDVSRALAAVHDANLLHRDVKAHNVMRDEDGRVVLSDFGTGVAYDQTALGAGLAGTPLYLAPELFAGQPASVASDLYSVGVLLFYLMTGRYPVTAASVDEIAARHVAGRRAHLGDLLPDADPEVIRLIDRLLARSPARRPRSAHELASDIKTLLGEAPGSGARRRWLTPAVAVVAAVAAGGAILWPGSRWQSGTDGWVPAASPITRQIIDPACTGVPSRDGAIACVELLTHVLDRGGKPPLPLVWYRPLTGEMRVLYVPPEGVRLAGAAISPDGRRVAYTVSSPGEEPRVVLRDIATGEERTLPPLASQPTMLEVLGWSSVGDQLDLRVWLPEGVHQLVVLAVESGGTVAEHTFAGTPQAFSRSPDGQWVAFDHRPSEDEPERDVRICAIGRHDRCFDVAAHPGNDGYPTWSPDGSLFFASDRSGVNGLWRIAFDGAKVGDTPELVRDTGRSRPWPIGFLAEGTLLYNLIVDDFDVYTAALGDAAMRPVRLSPRVVDMNKSPKWSPDGRSLAYVSRRGPFAETGATRVVLHDRETGREREFRYDLRPNMTRLAWSPDAKTLAMRTLIGADPRSGRFGIHLISVADGSVVRTLQRQNPPERFIEDRIGDIAWKDRDWVVFSSHGGVRQMHSVTAVEEELWRSPDDQVVEALTLSPDRRRIAITTIENFEDPARMICRTIVMDAAGGGAREVLRDDAPRGSLVVEWAPGGDSLLAVRWETVAFRDRRFRLWRVPLDGSAPEALALSHQQIAEVSLRPGSDTLVFMMGAPHVEFWVMTGAMQ